MTQPRGITEVHVETSEPGAMSRLWRVADSVDVAILDTAIKHTSGLSEPDLVFVMPSERCDKFVNELARLGYNRVRVESL